MLRVRNRYLLRYVYYKYTDVRKFLCFFRVDVSTGKLRAPARKRVELLATLLYTTLSLLVLPFATATKYSNVYSRRRTCYMCTRRSIIFHLLRYHRPVRSRAQPYTPPIYVFIQRLHTLDKLLREKRLARARHAQPNIDYGGSLRKSERCEFKGTLARSHPFYRPTCGTRVRYDSFPSAASSR